MDEVQARRLRLGAQGLGLLVRQVRHDHAIGAGVGRGPREALEPEGQHRVVVGEEHDRQPHLGAQGGDQLEHA